MLTYFLSICLLIADLGKCEQSKALQNNTQPDPSAAICSHYSIKNRVFELIKKIKIDRGLKIYLIFKNWGTTITALTYESAILHQRGRIRSFIWNALTLIYRETLHNLKPSMQALSSCCVHAVYQQQNNKLISESYIIFEK